MKIKIHTYDTRRFPFCESAEMMLGTYWLENLHHMGNTPSEIVRPGGDNHTSWHLKFYDQMRTSGFMDIYERLLREVIKPIFNGEELVVQARPTFRIHWVGNLSVGEFHRDSDYNHNQAEINFWLPVTSAYGSNSILIESARGARDFTPQQVLYGEILEFPGSELMHGNLVNDTPDTRVSFDFRVIPKSQYVEPAEPKAGLGHGLHKFKIGEYYRVV